MTTVKDYLNKNKKTKEQLFKSKILKQCRLLDSQKNYTASKTLFNKYFQV
jgi:hypothetical protein